MYIKNKQVNDCRLTVKIFEIKRSQRKFYTIFKNLFFCNFVWFACNIYKKDCNPFMLNPQTYILRQNKWQREIVNTIHSKFKTNKYDYKILAHFIFFKIKLIYANKKTLKTYADVSLIGKLSNGLSYFSKLYTSN